ncbi:piggyBac transposable element-derived protein 4-like [Littorina saxatilis]|uniref:PiggyBac transposable element-derived protein domain-containing protein n=1 Tax=Littorina saxatilis TaxID=31220 RepID=A0AAN9BIF1_9CAEN
MENLSNGDFWRAIMGESDSDEGGFEGFSLDEINKKDESDIDLDVVVNDEQLLREFESSDSDRDSDNHGDSGDSDMILPVLAAPNPRRKKKRLSKQNRNELTTRWSDRTTPVQPKKFDVGVTPVGPQHDLPPDAAEYDYFSLLIPEPFWEDIATQTNLYAAQKQAQKGADKNWTPTTGSEMKLFIFIQYMFGIHRMPDTAMYWSSDPLLRVPAIADVMSRNRFQKLSQYFHLNDNSKAVPKGQPGHDALFKVRPLLDMVTNNCRAHYNPGRDISIDEAMIKFNGRLTFKQYIKGKPNPWGIKVWCAADPRNGYMLEFDIYQGRATVPIPNGLGHHVVMTLASRFLNAGHHIFFDNYFSSVRLGQDLEKAGTSMCSTIRLNRQGWPKELSSAVAKKMKPGDIHFRQDGNMVATLWKDKRPVAVLSTNAQSAMGKHERRAPGGRKEVSVPEPVLVYNGSMGGVDLADQYHSYYPVGRPSVRWWRYICWWLMQTAMVNAFVIWKETHRPARSKKGLRHLDFRLQVLRALCKGNVSRKRAAAQAIAQAGVIDSSPLTHKIVRLPGRKKNCKMCEKKKVRTPRGHGVETVFGCVICDLHLCKGECFAEFHQHLAQSIH